MRIVKSLVPALLLASLFSSLSYAVTPDRISGAIDSSQMVALGRSLHPKAQQQYDQGPVEPSFKLGYVTLLMAPSASQQKALDQLLAQQQDPRSPNYHKWLSPRQYADRFGLSQNDLDKVTTWLRSQGFAILSIGGGRNSVSFSGMAGQVGRTFGTQIHSYKINGERHFANSTPLRIPSILEGIVTEVMGLHSFHPQPASRGRGFHPMRNARPDYYDGNFVFPNFLAPGDIATIYHIDPLYTASTPIDGTGQKLAVVGQTDVYLADINDFRSGFGLNPISGCTLNASNVVTACNSTYFQYVLVGADPGTPSGCGDLGEADLDIEWSGATAPGAQIVYVNAPVTYDANCNVTSGNGVNDALNTAINPPSGPPLAPVVSISYGICEAFAANLETLLQQGNAEGVTIVNSSGDVGAAACDLSPPNTTQPFSPAVGGLAVSYPASSPEVTGVGGTAISLANDSYPGQSSFWSTTIGANGGTVASYIPETPWNDEEEWALYCHSPVSGDTFCSQGGSTAVPGWVPLTSTATAAQVQQDIWLSIGGGGASNCFVQTGVACTAGFPQPTWQQGLSVSLAPAGVRYVPDVSLLASPNFPGYVYCTAQNPPTTPTSTCNVSVFDAVDTFQSIVGGTSASTPVFAGMVTLLNQYLAGPSSPGLGNINPTLYALANPKSNNLFHQVTTGDNDVYCQGGTPSTQPLALRCPGASGTTGVLGYSASNADAKTGYNLVTGLGSVDLNSLAIAWGGSRAASTVSISPSASQISQGQNVTFTATVSSSTAVGNVSFFNNGSTTALGTATLTTTSNGVATFSTTTLPTGTNNVTATYNGDALIKPATTTTAATVTVIQPTFTVASNPTSTTVVAGHTAPTTGTITVTITPANGYNQVTTPSCTGLPTGATCAFNPTTVTPDGVHAITTSMTISTAASMAAATTAIMISASGGGVTPQPVAFSLTTTATDQSFTIAPQNGSYTVTRPQSANVTLTLTPVNGFNTAVTYTCTDPASESTCTGPSGPTTSTSPAFVITTTAPTRAQVMPFGGGMRSFYAALLPGLLGIMFTVGSRKRSLRGMRLLGLIVALGFSTLWLGSCGGNSGTKNPGTPPGPYSISVNATTGGANPVTATTTINLTVQ
jgi:subtilase family serine protease